MKNTSLEFAKSLPALSLNAHLNLGLEGWPATVAVIAICISSVTAYAISVLNPEVLKQTAEAQRPHNAA